MAVTTDQGSRAPSTPAVQVYGGNWDERELKTPNEIDDFLSQTSELELLTDVGGELEVVESGRSTVAAFKNGPVVIAAGQRWTATVKSLFELAKNKASPVQQEIVIAPRDTVAKIYEDRQKTASTVVGTQQNDQVRQTELRVLIGKAAKDGASDIHIIILPHTTVIKFRVNGRMQPHSEISVVEGPLLVRAALNVSSDQTLNASELSSQQGALTKKSALLPSSVDLIRLQYLATTEQRGAMIMRLKYQGGGAKSNIEELGYAPGHIEDMAVMRRRTNGGYLLAGKVSSGKSTTLERQMNKMYEEKKKEIAIHTIEEPIELQIDGAIQVGISSSDEADRRRKFASAMKDVLRSDPNVIVVGEMRDPDTAALCIEASKTGHSIWSTVHAGSALGILDRLESLDIGKHEIADPSIIRGLVYQRLVGVTCPECRLNYIDAVEKKHLDPKLANRVMTLTHRKPTELFVRNPDGCKHCDKGLVGRTVVAEVIMTNAKLLDFYLHGDRTGMWKYWTNPIPVPGKPEDERDGAARLAEEPDGMGGLPVLHHAIVKIGAGILDVNEVEEEVDLIEAYEEQYPRLVPRLRSDINALIAASEGKAVAKRLVAQRRANAVRMTREAKEDEVAMAAAVAAANEVQVPLKDGEAA